MAASVISVSPNDAQRKLQAREISYRIKDKALGEGFEKVGIVAAAALDNERNQLIEWLGRGHHGHMSWMARDPEMRADPRKLFPAARSVVVVAINYYTPQAHTHDQATGKISRYAWGEDYHEVVSAKLRSLLEWIREEVPAGGRKSLRRHPTDDG